MAYADPEHRRAVDRERRRVKIQAMHEYLGGRCVVCGSQERLEFHHRDPTQKSFNIAQGWTKSWEALTVELDKCELRCFEHHKQQHASVHGTLSMATNQGCRCDLCAPVFREYDRQKQARYRAQRRQALMES